MLIKFTVENYLSIKNPTTLDMTSSSIKELEEENVIATARDNYLKCIAIYGANASGKSNLLKALVFIKKLILNSSKDQDYLNEVAPFKLDVNTEDKPSKFELEFSLNRLRYRYLIEVDNDRVHKEELYFTRVNKEYCYFTRNLQHFSIDDKFLEGKGIENLVRPNALFLSVVSQFNGRVSMEITRWINDVKYILDTDRSFHQNYSMKLFERPEYRSLIKKYLLRADLGFSDIETQKINIPNLPDFDNDLRNLLFAEFADRNILMTMHTKFEENKPQISQVYFDMFKSESLGTQKYFAMSGLIIEALLHGKVLIIDEFDARLHPTLCLSIIKLFNSKINNPRNAQLIFVTHNTSFLSKNILRRDQVCLANKDVYGRTSLKSLAQMKIRSDESFEKNYLAGEYNGVPKIDDINLF